MKRADNPRAHAAYHGGRCERTRLQGKARRAGKRGALPPLPTGAGNCASRAKTRKEARNGDVVAVNAWKREMKAALSRPVIVPPERVEAFLRDEWRPE